jgi:D-alanyl-lipoteichoic acid acyltransferase DltB (MBOAT superfamily)
VPLGGNKVPKPRRFFNTIFVFTLSGIWHGASWNYVLWGFVNGVFIVYVIMTKKLRTKIAQKMGLLKFPRFNILLNILGTMTFIVFQRVIFRSTTIKDAVYILKRCAAIFNEWVLIIRSVEWNANHLFYNVNVFEIRLAIFGILVFMWLEYISRKVTIDHFIGSFPKIGRWTFYITSFFILYLQGTYGSKQFIYFQF